MTTYFDMVNDDIISQILIHVNDVMSYGKLVTLNFFGHVLGNYKFWNMLVKVKFSNITFDLIPNYLYTFDKKDDFIIWYSNYFRLNSAYSYATRYTNNFEKELRETGEYYGKKSEGYKFHAPTMRFALNLVNNIKVLNLYYTERISSELEKRLFEWYPLEADDSWTIISLTYKEYFSISISSDSSSSGEISYILTKRDVFNLLLHVFCNGYHTN